MRHAWALLLKGKRDADIAAEHRSGETVPSFSHFAAATLSHYAVQIAKYCQVRDKSVGLTG